MVLRWVISRIGWKRRLLVIIICSQGMTLIWHIGTGYFGCRKEEGTFNEIMFKKNAVRPEVKMIEVKLSQGSKPGHGGICPL
jgi:glutamate synthase domain-containing protein 2